MTMVSHTTLAGGHRPDFAPAPPQPTATEAGRRRTPWPYVCGAVVVACALAGAVARGWLSSHQPFDSDAAVVGLMAEGILHGHFTAFFWGQSYGGVEPFVVAALVEVFGHNWLPLTLTPALLMVVTSLLTWRAALRLVGDRWLAALAGALVWVMPTLGIDNMTEFGFRNLTVALGVALLLLSLRVLDGRSGYLDVCALGLVTGVGWWASPEITYYIVPGLAIASAAVIGTWGVHRARYWLPRIAAAAVSVGLGALPWLWSNVPNGFRSLNTATETTAHDGDYVNHLQVFFTHVVTLQLGLRGFAGLTPVVTGVAGTVVEWFALAILAGSLLMCLTRVGRAWAIAAALLAFPFLYALNPISWWWEDGRYAEYLPPLIVLTLVIGCERFFELLRRSNGRVPIHGRRTARDRSALARIAMAVIVLLALLVSGFGFLSIAKGGSSLIPTGDPDSPTMHVVALLEQDHVEVGYANYWVAYKLDYLSGGRLVFSPDPYWGEVRSATLYHQVTGDRHSAWLFVPPDEQTVAGLQMTTLNDEPGFDSKTPPGADPEAAFLAELRRTGDPYRVIHADFIDAVLPAIPVNPAEVGLGTEGAG